MESVATLKCVSKYVITKNKVCNGDDAFNTTPHRVWVADEVSNVGQVTMAWQVS